MDMFNRFMGKRTGRLEKKWVFDSKSQILSPPVVSDNGNSIVFGTRNGDVYSLKEDSTLNWVYSIKEEMSKVEMLFLEKEFYKGIYASPAVGDINNDKKKEVIVGSNTGKLYALDNNGKLLWRFTTNDIVRSSPLIADINNDYQQEIVFGSNDNFLYCLNSKGKPIWRFKASSGIESSPAIFMNMIVFGSNNGVVYCLNQRGKLLWEFSTNGKIAAKAVIGDVFNSGSPSIIVGSCDDFLYVLSHDGQLKWKYQTEGRIYSDVCLADINDDKRLEMIFGSCDNNLYVLSSNGTKIWSYASDFWIVDKAVVVDIDKDGKLEIIAGSYDHSLYIFEAEGIFSLEYMPGLSGIVQQVGHYSELISSEPCIYIGKKLWQFRMDDMIVGIACFENKEGANIIVATKDGKLSNVILRK